MTVLSASYAATASFALNAGDCLGENFLPNTGTGSFVGRFDVSGSLVSSGSTQFVGLETGSSDTVLVIDESTGKLFKRDVTAVSALPTAEVEEE